MRGFGVTQSPPSSTLGHELLNITFYVILYIMNFSAVEFATNGNVPVEALEIRKTVFIEGQNVPVERERDGLDAEADHYVGYGNGQPVATARVRHIEEGTAKIERVAVLPGYQGKHYGLDLMQHILDHLRAQDIEKAVLEAQTYAQAFYEKLGFTATGDIFEDANIPHIKMVSSLTKPATETP